VDELAAFKLNVVDLIHIFSRSAYDSWRIDGICVTIILCCWIGSAGRLLVGTGDRQK